MSFEVVACKKEVVAAALPVQEYWLPLSNLDLMLPPVDFCVFFCYDAKPYQTSFGYMVNILKKALAETLVSYYAFAGEVTNNSLGEPELLCNNNGIEFFEAYADIELNELNLHKLEDSIYKFVPNKKDGVMAIQATELKCGSLIISSLFDHRITDAYSANLFLVSWAEIARSKPMSVFPSFRRSLLSPRHPLQYDASIDDMYMPLSSIPHQKENSQANLHGQFISRIYYIKANKIDELQTLACYNGSRITKLEAFSAFLWKLVAKSAGKVYDTKKSTMGVVVDGRRRIAGDRRDNNINNNNMDSYVGNVLTAPFGGYEVNELVENPLHVVASEVHSIIKIGATKQHFLGLIDWIEAHRPKPITPKIYWVDDGPSFLVSSGQRFPVRKVDFGWGQPTLGSYYFPKWDGNAGYVMPMPSVTADGDWVAYMLLRKGQLDTIEEEAVGVFKPMSSDYMCKRTASL